MNGKRPTLIVVTGPTGSGKTALSIEIARELGCHIVSADSRQIYREIPIGTAAPDSHQLSLVPHHFVGILELEDYYSAARYEEDVMQLLPSLWEESDYAVMCGGSMMYVDAVTRGIDTLPAITPEIREKAYSMYAERGLDFIREELRRIDPTYYKLVDKDNHKRIVHAIEITMQAGVPYSSLRTGEIKERPFSIVKMAIDHPRQELFDRINLRVDAMMEAGFEDEARRVYPKRGLNALNTVGFKEMFAMFDGTMDRSTAIARMAKNTRVYAKKQLTWLKQRTDTVMLPPDNVFERAMELIYSSDTKPDRL